MVGTNSVKLMRSRAIVGKHRLGIETLQHVHGAAAHQRRQHLCAGDMADRRHREIARRIRDLEIGEDRGGEAGILAVIAQRALGFAGGAAGVVQRREIVGPGEAARGGAAGGFDGLQEVDAVAGGPEREHRLEALGPGGELAAAVAERRGIDHQHLGFGILELEQLVVERAQRMQRGDASRDSCAATPAHQVSARLAVSSATRVPGCKAEPANTPCIRPIRSVAPGRSASRRARRNAVRTG